MHLCIVVPHSCSHTCSHNLHLLKFYLDSWTTHSTRCIIDGMTEGRETGRTRLKLIPHYDKDYDMSVCIISLFTETAAFHNVASNLCKISELILHIRFFQQDSIANVSHSMSLQATMAPGNCVGSCETKEDLFKCIYLVLFCTRLLSVLLPKQKLDRASLDSDTEIIDIVSVLIPSMYFSTPTLCFLPCIGSNKFFKQVSVAPGGRWNKFKTYSTIQRTLEIWGFVISFLFKAWLNNQKFMYKGKVS